MGTIPTTHESAFAWETVRTLEFHSSFSQQHPPPNFSLSTSTSHPNLIYLPIFLENSEPLIPFLPGHSLPGPLASFPDLFFPQYSIPWQEKPLMPQNASLPLPTSPPSRTLRDIGGRVRTRGPVLRPPSPVQSDALTRAGLFLAKDY